MLRAFANYYYVLRFWKIRLLLVARQRYSRNKTILITESSFGSASSELRSTRETMNDRAIENSASAKVSLFLHGK